MFWRLHPLGCYKTLFGRDWERNEAGPPTAFRDKVAERIPAEAINQIVESME